MKLKITSVVLALIFCSFAQVQGAKDTCGKSERSDSENQVKSWPWIVALKYWPENKFLCSGFLVSENVVVAGKNIISTSVFSFTLVLKPKLIKTVPKFSHSRSMLSKREDKFLHIIALRNRNHWKA